MNASSPAPPALLECIEIGPRPDEPADASVIWLHGLGADGHDFEPIPPLLKLPGVRFILPHSERRRVTINGGMKMRAWYDILSLDFGGPRESERDIRVSTQAIEALIERERERGVPSERIVLVGFSQGAAMALHVGLRHPRRLAGVAALSGYLVLGESLAEERSPENTQTPLLMCHGTEDPVVPVWLGKAAYDQITALDPQRPSAWFDYPMPHSVCPEELAEIGRWLHGLLD